MATRRSTKLGIGKVRDPRDTFPPAPPVSCPSPEPPEAKRRETVKGPRATKTELEKANAKRADPRSDPPREPTTDGRGRYASVPDTSEEVVLGPPSERAPRRPPPGGVSSMPPARAAKGTIREERVSTPAEARAAKTTIREERVSTPAEARAAKTTFREERPSTPAETRAAKTTFRGAPEPRTAKRAVPRLAKTDLGGASIAPRDAFLLSRVDGTLAIDELADSTGMSERDVLESLGRMARLGLVLM